MTQITNQFQPLTYYRDEHRVHCITYHLVWCPKRRKPVLTGDIADDCRRLIETTCSERGWEVIELSLEPDRIHLFVRVWPSVSAADVVKACKGITSNVLRQQYAVLRKLPSLWTRSYFASTDPEFPGEMVQRYIEAQKGV